MSFIDKAKHMLHSHWKNAVEAITPTPTHSQFEEKRLLTPEEFITAGDYLVGTVGSWQWEGGDESMRVSYLPPGKQFLVTRNVPCRSRATAMLDDQDEAVASGEAGEGADWIVTKSSQGAAGTKAGEAEAADRAAGGIEDNDDDDDLYVPPVGQQQSRRSYDLYITYSKYYQVPQFWLVGFGDDKVLLSKSQVEQDVAADHMDKTVTDDPFPHVAKLHAMSIHPCKHANTMKIFGDQQVANGKEFVVAHYLILFLKFISGIVPTIEYDYSMEYNMGS